MDRILTEVFGFLAQSLFKEKQKFTQSRKRKQRQSFFHTYTERKG